VWAIRNTTEGIPYEHVESDETVYYKVHQSPSPLAGEGLGRGGIDGFTSSVTFPDMGPERRNQGILFCGRIAEMFFTYYKDLSECLHQDKKEEKRDEKNN